VLNAKKYQKLRGNRRRRPRVRRKCSSSAALDLIVIEVSTQLFREHGQLTTGISAQVDAGILR
jgi:hypothetical protein